MRCLKMMDYIPSIRSEIAKELYKRGYTKKEIAEILNCTLPSISYYLKGYRGKRELPEIALKIIRKKSGNIRSFEDFSRLVCEICKVINA